MTLLKNDIYWVGVVDWNVRDFHSFDTPCGATYNSYLVRGEKNVLIDTVKAPFAEELLRNVREIVPLDKIDYVVCNHAEPDHSGALPAVMAALPNATLLCNAKCREILAGYYDISSWKIELTDPAAPRTFGGRSLVFLNVPMVHWPDSMVSYMPEEKILFSNDAFGQHIATSERFDDECDLSLLLYEAKTYYANIVAPYGRQVLKTLEAAAKLDIEMIAPSHGLIWRGNIPAIVSAYQDWASGKQAAKVLVVYDSMWDSTDRMAREILRGARSIDGVEAQLHHVRKTTLARLAAELFDAGAVAFGSATINTQMMPQMGAVLTYVKGLKFSEKKSMAFGSHGWGPGAPEAIAKWLDEAHYTAIVPIVKAKWRPDDAVLRQCFEAGQTLAKAVR